MDTTQNYLQYVVVQNCMKLLYKMGDYTLGKTQGVRGNRCKKWYKITPIFSKKPQKIIRISKNTM